MPPTSFLTHTPTVPTNNFDPAMIPGTLPLVASKKGRNADIDSLLSSTTVQRPEVNAQAAVMAEVMEEPRPGIFLGLRIALLFNAGLGIAGVLAYEAWQMLAH